MIQYADQNYPKFSLFIDNWNKDIEQLSPLFFMEETLKDVRKRAQDMYKLMELDCPDDVDLGFHWVREVFIAYYILKPEGRKNIESILDSVSFKGTVAPEAWLIFDAILDPEGVGAKKPKPMEYYTEGQGLSEEEAEEEIRKNQPPYPREKGYPSIYSLLFYTLRKYQLAKLYEFEQTKPTRAQRLNFMTDNMYLAQSNLLLKATNKGESEFWDPWIRNKANDYLVKLSEILWLDKNTNQLCIKKAQKFCTFIEDDAKGRYVLNTMNHIIRKCFHAYFMKMKDLAETSSKGKHKLVWSYAPFLSNSMLESIRELPANRLAHSLSLTEQIALETRIGYNVEQELSTPNRIYPYKQGGEYCSTPKGSLWIYMAGTGQGKSYWMSMHLANMLMNQEFKNPPLYFSYEIDPVLVYARTEASLFNQILLTELKAIYANQDKPTLIDNEMAEAIHEVYKQTANPAIHPIPESIVRKGHMRPFAEYMGKEMLHVLQCYRQWQSRMATDEKVDPRFLNGTKDYSSKSSIEAELNNYVTRYGAPPKFIYMDWLGYINVNLNELSLGALCGSGSNAKSSSWERGEAVARYLSVLAETYETVVITANQTNTAPHHLETTLDNVSYGKYIVNPAYFASVSAMPFRFNAEFAHVNEYAKRLAGDFYYPIPKTHTVSGGISGVCKMRGDTLNPSSFGIMKDFVYGLCETSPHYLSIQECMDEKEIIKKEQERKKAAVLYSLFGHTAQSVESEYQAASSDFQAQPRAGSSLSGTYNFSSPNASTSSVPMGNTFEELDYLSSGNLEVFMGETGEEVDDGYLSNKQKVKGKKEESDDFAL